MPNNAGKWLVETDWLAERLDAPDLIVLDASWHLPTIGRDAKAEYAAAHIPGARFFDIDDIADENSPLPHMLPSTVKFASRMKKMGVGDGMRVIVYNSQGSCSAARAWWMFRVMGHDDVAVLNGGLGKWCAEGQDVEDMPPPPRTTRHFTPRVNAALVRDADDIRAVIGTGGAQVVDARSAARFAGTASEPRAGLRLGHIPGSRNAPFDLLLNPDGTYKSPEAIAAVFTAAGIDMKRPIITTCGSGITACVLSLGLALCGTPDAGVYDGSWAEWGASDAFPRDIGPAT